MTLRLKLEITSVQINLLSNRLFYAKVNFKKEIYKIKNHMLNVFAFDTHSSVYKKNQNM